MYGFDKKFSIFKNQGSVILTLSCMNLGHEGSKIFLFEIQFLLFKGCQFNKSRGTTTLLWQPTRMLLRNNMQERHRILRNFKVKSRY